jgi:hypothetical protein
MIADFGHVKTGVLETGPAQEPLGCSRIGRAGSYRLARAFDQR